MTEAAASALTSYALDPFTTITASLLNGQGAACWAASTSDGRFTFTANAATNSISAYSQNWKGELSLVTPGGATAQLAAGTHPLDEIVSRDRFLYVNGGNTGQINAFKIGWNGSLTRSAPSARCPSASAAWSPARRSHRRRARLRPCAGRARRRACGARRAQKRPDRTRVVDPEESLARSSTGGVVPFPVARASN